MNKQAHGRYTTKEPSLQNNKKCFFFVDDFGLRSSPVIIRRKKTPKCGIPPTSGLSCYDPHRTPVVLLTLMLAGASTVRRASTLREDTSHARSKYHTQVATIIFDEVFDLSSDGSTHPPIHPPTHPVHFCVNTCCLALLRLMSWCSTRKPPWRPLTQAKGR